MTVYATPTLVPTHPPALRTRKPTGKVSAPLIVVDGDASSGRSWMVAANTGNDRLGQAYWIAWGAADQKTVDEYKHVPGADYEIVLHDGHFWSIFEQVLAVKVEARRAYEAGEPPVVLVVDSATSIWNEIKTWTYRRSAASKEGRKLLAIDPYAILKPGRNLWNDARDRYRALMTQLLTFHGVVVLIVRGDYVSGTDANGQPTADQVYKLDCHESLERDATVCITMARGKAKPLAWKARSVHAGINTSAEARELPEQVDLAWLVFDLLKWDPRHAGTEAIVEVPEPLELTVGAGEPDPDGDTPRPERTAAPSPDGAPQLTGLDWHAELTTAKGIADPVTKHKALTDLWKAAKFGGAEPAVITLIEEAADALPEGVKRPTKPATPATAEPATTSPPPAPAATTPAPPPAKPARRTRPATTGGQPAGSPS